MEELSGISRLRPAVIGRVTGRGGGGGELIVPSNVMSLIADKALANKLSMPVLTIERQRRAVMRIRGGEVQGVGGLRPSIKRKAMMLGLTGFARNEPDGTVTAVVEGGTHLE